MSQAPYARVAMGLHFLNPPSVLAEIPQTADRNVVTVRDQLEVGSQPVLLLALAKAITDGRVELVVDLGALDSIDTEDVGMLIRASTLLRSRGQHLVVRAPCALKGRRHRPVGST